MGIFKEGDIVKRIKGFYSGMESGQTDTVLRCGLHKISLKKYGGGHDPRSFELVETIKETKMKKFKNKLAVKGSKSLLKAFVEELNLMGYINAVKDDSAYTYNPLKVLLINRKGCGQGTYFNQDSHIGSNYDYNLSLPLDWNRALKLAAEIEEEVPEYVECTYSDDFTKFKKGKIYKVQEGSKSPRVKLINEEGFSGYTDGYPMNGGVWKFKPSTKEAFDAQNKPVFKEVDWLYSKNSSYEYLTKFYNVSEQTKLESKEFYTIHLKRPFVEGPESAAYVCDIKDKDVRLANKEEIERILLTVAKSKYPIGTKIKKIGMNMGGDFDNEIRFTNSNYAHFSPQLFVDTNTLIYQSGKWAEILPSEVKVNGYVVERITTGQVKVGCKTFYIKQLEDLYKFLVQNGGTYHIDGKDWGAQCIKDLLKTVDKM